MSIPTHQNITSKSTHFSRRLFLFSSGCPQSLGAVAGPNMAHLTSCINNSALAKTLLQRLSARTQTFTVANKSTTSSTAVDDLDLEAIAKDSAAPIAQLVHDAEYEQRELDIQSSRNKSRLLPQHRNMLNDARPYDGAQSWIHNTVKYARMQFGRHGLASGIDPRVCFATATETATRAEYERVAFPLTLPEMMAVQRQQSAERRRAIVEREETIVKKLGKLDQWTAELNAKVAKRESDAKAARARKDRLVEEVRRQFGFKVDARDERFIELLAQKEKEDKKRQKEEKKKQKDERMLAKLQEQHSLEFKKPDAV